MDDRIQVTYGFIAASNEAAATRAREIALEQTVELPDGAYPVRVEREIVARVESLDAAGERRWRATLSFPADLVGSDVPQFVNLVFGNVSMHADVRVLDVALPATLLELLPGPQRGIAGMRALVPAASGRPLLLSAAKPVGLTSAELADRCAALARGGIDIIKDDHGLSDQRFAGFQRRVERCAEAVRGARSDEAPQALYFPNVTAPFEQIAERVELARAAGCRGVVVSPFLVGLDVLRWLAASSGMAVLTHPAHAGGLLRWDHGIAPDVLFGHLLRVLGADGVIFMNPGGRFTVAETDADAVVRRLRAPIEGIRAALPVLGGGVDADRVPQWIDRYGVDCMFLVGSSLYAQPDLEEAARRLRDAVEGHCLD
ncbi:MAG: RuBisCO large subunit C-terminal-like domain-containing protein [Gemmatimonadales bacterium]|jgi:ribulose-bisphosphate carboxylase large chain